MGANIHIEWCDHTFNPWVGCTKISPACDHCYAADWAKRFGAVEWGRERKRTGESYWHQPIAWNRAAERGGVRRRVFCASLADVFDNQVPGQWRADLWGLISVTPQLDWLLLTKRPQNIEKMLPVSWGDGWPNVWLGTTVENQQEAERRIPHLLRVPARVHFLSCEPLLGPLLLQRSWLGWKCCITGGQVGTDFTCGDCDPCLGGLGRRFIRWVICGGESGPHARPMHPDWARRVRNQCLIAGVPFFFKQWGSWKNGSDFKPDAMAVTEDGRVLEPTSVVLRAADRIAPVGNPTLMRRVGKRAAGALLDDREWRQFPHVAEILETCG